MAFPLLSKVNIQGSPGIYYRFKSETGFIEELYPAGAFISHMLMDISNRWHSASLCHERIARSYRKIREGYEKNRSTYGSGYPKLYFNDELHELRADYASLLYLIRASLDQIASCVYELLGVKRDPVRSFAKLIKDAEKGKSDLPLPIEAKLVRVRDWFFKMRDIRDYISHLGFVRVTIWETSEKDIDICIHDRIDLPGSADYFYKEFTDLLRSLDLLMSDHLAVCGVEPS